MRIALHTGKGGVGKTTISAATAIAAALAGYRTLLLSTDPAHSVADVLDVPVGADPVPVPGVPGLWAAHVDVRIRFEEAWSSVRGYLVDLLAARGIAAVQAEELTVLPGADEIIGLLELSRLAETEEFDAIVVDCAPSGETLRLLALPETLAFYADRLMGAPARLMRSLAAGLSGLAGRGNGRTGPDAEVRDALADLLARLGQARKLLTDPDVTRIRLVLTAERMVIAEARRLWTALCLHGFAVESVVVNRLLPENPGMDVFGSWLEAQREGLVAVTESFSPLEIRELQLAGAEPIGVIRLRELGERLFAGADPLAGAPVPEGISTTEIPGGYLLRLPLPLATRGELELSRAADDLVVTVGQFRRRLALPSLLQRCLTVGARLADNALFVEFAPDPQRWPAVVPQPQQHFAADSTADRTADDAEAELAVDRR